MSLKEFKDDFKIMLKSKDSAEFNRKYVDPAKDWAKDAASTTKSYIDKYTPIILASAKKAWDEGQQTFQRMKKTADEKEAQEFKKDVEDANKSNPYVNKTYSNKKTNDEATYVNRKSDRDPSTYTPNTSGTSGRKRPGA